MRLALPSSPLFVSILEEETPSSEEEKQSTNNLAVQKQNGALVYGTLMTCPPKIFITLGLSVCHHQPSKENHHEANRHRQQIQYMGAPFYISSILGFKLALLFSYLRFIPKGIYRYMTIGVIVACCLFHLSFLIVQINLCQPIALQWDPTITEGSCIKGVPFYTSMASLTIVFDVIV